MNMKFNEHGVVVTLARSCDDGEARAELAGGLIAVLAPALLQSGLQALGDSLVRESGKNDSTFTTQGVQRTYFYTLDPQAITPIRHLNEEMMCITVTIADKFELRVQLEVSRDRSAMALIPVLARYESRIGVQRKVESLSVTVDFVAADGTTFATGALPLGLAPSTGRVWRAPDLAHAVTGWMPLLPVSDALNTSLAALLQKTARRADLDLLINDETDAKKKAAFQAEATRVDVEVAELRKQLTLHGPATVRVTVAETQDVSQFLAALGEALSGKKAELASAVVDKFFPKESTPQERASVTSAVGGYWVKRFEFDEAARLHDVLKADPQTPAAELAKARIAAVNAQYAALSAAILAGITIQPSDALRVFSI